MGNEGTKLVITNFKQMIRIIITITVFTWAVWLINTIIFGGWFNRFGITPRQLGGLPGIIFSPFLHGSFNHIFNNTISFVLFSPLVLMRGVNKFKTVSIISMLISGLGIWIIGADNSLHIGASGVIFGYFGYCISVGFIEKKLSTVLFSILFILVYGGMIWQILPVTYGVSWEGHLFGLIGGFVSAVVLHRQKV